MGSIGLAVVVAVVVVAVVLSLHPNQPLDSVSLSQLLVNGSTYGVSQVFVEVVVISVEVFVPVVVVVSSRHPHQPLTALANAEHRCGFDLRSPACFSPGAALG